MQTKHLIAKKNNLYKRGEEEVKGTITGEPISHEEMLSAYPFKQIREFKGLTIEEKAETQEELVSKPKQEEIVTGISEAPESLLNKVYPKVEEPTEEEIAESPVLTDNSFFATDDELKEAIEQTPETPIEDIKEEPDGDEPDGLALLDEIAKEKENSQEPKTKDIVIPEDDEKHFQNLTTITP